MLLVFTLFCLGEAVSLIAALAAAVKEKRLSKPALCCALLVAVTGVLWNHYGMSLHAPYLTVENYRDPLIHSPDYGVRIQYSLSESDADGAISMSFTTLATSQSSTTRP